MVNAPAKKKTILVVEDEEALRTSLQQLFRNTSYNVLLATDGDQALAQLRNHHVDLVILDVLMPHKDGLETIVEIKRQSPTLPVFMMAEPADKTFDALAAAEKFGADATFRKPVSGAELIAKIEAAFGGKG
jgi:DNA-binding response OmpR family regulator